MNLLLIDVSGTFPGQLSLPEKQKLCKALAVHEVIAGRTTSNKQLAKYI